MNTNLGKCIIGYGVFLLLMGVAGYLSNPEKAITALISGGVFGSLSLVWGILLVRGHAWSRWAALVTTIFLAGVFTWRATVTWTKVAEGNVDKWVAAALISAMGLASFITLALLAGCCSRWCARRERGLHV